MQGSRGADVKVLQRHLTDAGHNVRADGVFGRRTGQAPPPDSAHKPAAATPFGAEAQQSATWIAEAWASTSSDHARSGYGPVPDPARRNGATANDIWRSQ